MRTDRDSINSIGIVPLEPTSTGELALFKPQTLTDASRPALLSRKVLLQLAAVVAVGALVVVSTPLVDTDTAIDLVATATAVAHNIWRMPWTVLPVLVAATAVHYIAAAIALRSAAGTKLPLTETTSVQLAAAAANRLTPGGLGGAAVNGRYLCRKGFINSTALTAVAVLSIAGPISDLITFAGVALIGSATGILNSGQEVAALANKLAGQWAAFFALSWMLQIGILGAAALAIFAIAYYLRSTRQRAESRPWFQIVQFLRDPRRVLALLASSGATTLALAAGFAFTALAVAPHAGATFVETFVGFLVLGTVGNAVPLPSGMGTTEAALVTILLAAHIPASSALGVVLLFRLVTFWTPAVAGLVVVRRLRRHQLL